MPAVLYLQTLPKTHIQVNLIPYEPAVAVSTSAMHIRRFLSAHTRRLYSFEISATCADGYYKCTARERKTR